MDVSTGLARYVWFMDHDIECIAFQKVKHKGFFLFFEKEGSLYIITFFAPPIFKKHDKSISHYLKKRKKRRNKPDA